MDRSIRDGAPGRSALRLLVRRLCVTEVGFALPISGGVRSAPSGPNSALGPPPPGAPSVPTGKPAVLGVRLERDGLLVSVPPLSSTSRAFVSSVALDRLRKRVGQCSLERR